MFLKNTLKEDFYIVNEDYLFVAISLNKTFDMSRFLFRYDRNNPHL